MHVVLIIYMQHLSPPNVLSGFGRSKSAKMDAPGGSGRGGDCERAVGGSQGKLT